MYMYTSFLFKYLVSRGKLFFRLKRFSLSSGWQVQSETPTTLPRAGLAESQGGSIASFLLLLSCPKESSSSLFLKVFTSNNLDTNLITAPLTVCCLSIFSSPSLSLPLLSLCLIYNQSVMFEHWLIIVNNNSSNSNNNKKRKEEEKKRKEKK